MERGDERDAAERDAAERDAPEQVRAGEDAEWNRVERTAAFRELMQRKKAFLIPAVIFFLAFYMAMPILAEFTTILDGQAIGAMTWGYVYGFAQFGMTWILCHLYLSRAHKWDKLIEEARQEASEERTAH